MKTEKTAEKLEEASLHLRTNGHFFWLAHYLNKTSRWHSGKNKKHTQSYIYEILVDPSFPKDRESPFRNIFERQCEEYETKNKLTDPISNILQFNEEIAKRYEDYVGFLPANIWKKPLDSKVKIKSICILAFFLDNEIKRQNWLNYITRGFCNLKDYEQHFEGRKVALENIKQHLLKEDSDPVAICSVAKPLLMHSIGGQGKTALARQFALQNKASYGCILFIDASNKGSNHIQKLIVELKQQEICGDLPYKKNDKESELAFYIRCLQARYLRERILIILDDIQQIRELEDLFSLSKNPGINIIFTSRKNIGDLQSLVKTKLRAMPIEPLNATDAGTLLIQRGAIVGERPTSDIIQQIATTDLGGHALSVCLAGAYLKVNPSVSLDELHLKLKQGISAIDADAIEEDYSKSLQAAFNLSFVDACSKELQLVLVLLTLFPRINIPYRVVHESIVRVKHSSTKYCTLLARIQHKTKPLIVTEARNLDLVQFSDRSGNRQNPDLTMHEVVYDLLQHKLLQFRQDADFRELEKCFIQGCAVLGSNIIDEHRQLQGNSTNSSKRPVNITGELAAIAGLMIPTVNYSRGLVPNAYWCDLAVDFWFSNYRFHQFIYDSEILDERAASLRELIAHLEASNRFHGKARIVFDKLLGHAYYGNPRSTLAESQSHFTSAIAEIDCLSGKNQLDNQTTVRLKWFKVFLLDHYINVSSKEDRPASSATIPLIEDNEFGPQILEIENWLPNSLKDIDTRIEKDDHPLLLRAAHYWGHRGNQDSYCLFSQAVNRATNSSTPQLAERAIAHYLRAANYRVYALKLTFGSQMRNPINTSAIAKSDYIAQWIKDFQLQVPIRGIEDFTHFYQGMGDVAHQFRGMHSVYVTMNTLALIDSSINLDLEKMSSALKAARAFWKLATNRKEPSIRYKLWMCSSEVLNNELLKVSESGKVSNWDVLKKQTEKQIEDMQKQDNVSYAFAADTQIDQVKKIWNYLHQHLTHQD